MTDVLLEEGRGRLGRRGDEGRNTRHREDGGRTGIRQLQVEEDQMTPQPPGARAGTERSPRALFCGLLDLEPVAFRTGENEFLLH